jgi:hypothetical protein
LRFISALIVTRHGDSQRALDGARDAVKPLGYLCRLGFTGGVRQRCGDWLAAVGACGFNEHGGNWFCCFGWRLADGGTLKGFRQPDFDEWRKLNQSGGIEFPPVC